MKYLLKAPVVPIWYWRQFSGPIKYYCHYCHIDNILTQIFNKDTNKILPRWTCLETTHLRLYPRRHIERPKNRNYTTDIL